MPQNDTNQCTLSKLDKQPRRKRPVHEKSSPDMPHHSAQLFAMVHHPEKSKRQREALSHAAL
jgi:hypothetical protein